MKKKPDEIEQIKSRVLWSFENMRVLGYIEDRATIRRRMKDPVDPFPAPLQLSSNSLAWYADEIRSWVSRRPRGLAHDRRKVAADADA
jgi:predicted DNA-binding transcriptional regulator AlpA